MMMLCALALGGLAVGCGNNCKSVCEDGKKCSSDNPNSVPAALDCGKLCDDTDKVSDAANCNSEKDASLDCQSGLKDICSTTDTSCDAKANAFGTCIGTYCQAHSSDSACTTFYSDLGISLQ
jgi:hypothetical protein